MHAPSDRGSQIQLKKLSATAIVAVAVLGLAACSNSSSDTPTLQPPVTASMGTAPRLNPGPEVSITRVNGLPVPQLAGQTSINAALRQVGGSLSGTCSVAVERDDSRVGSFLWTCSSGSRTAVTFDQATSRKLSLDDLFQSGYRAYLTSTAAAQMKADGVSSPTATDFSVWYVTPTSLVVAFPQSVVSFPLVSLNTYFKTGGPLAG